MIMTFLNLRGRNTLSVKDKLWRWFQKVVTGVTSRKMFKKNTWAKVSVLEAAKRVWPADYQWTSLH